MRTSAGPGQAKDQDIASFSSLYRDTSADVLRYLLRSTPTPEDAADCLAETFLIAWSKRDQIPQDPRSWLFGVARNVMRRDRERDSRAEQASAALAAEIRSSPTWAEQITPDEHLIAALARLSQLDQEIITLSSWDDFSPREIARVLGLSPNVVRVRLHRARAKLRTTLSTPAEQTEERHHVQLAPDTVPRSAANGF